MMHETTRVPARPASSTLMDLYDESTAFLFMSRRGGLLVRDAVPLNVVDPSLAAISASARDLDSDVGGVLVGAIPFEASGPLQLLKARSWRATFESANEGLALGMTERPRATRKSPFRPEARPRVTAVRRAPTEAEYQTGVEAALAEIHAGRLDKVVLARSLSVLLDRPVNIAALLSRLFAQNPSAYRFALRLPGDSGAVGQRVFLGASPELLASRRGRFIVSNPLAGSVPRSSDPVEDARRAEALLRSDKDRREHAWVVDYVAEVVGRYCRNVEVPKAPSLVSTPTLWHLSTRVQGELRSLETTSLEVALALHPTPAVAGYPKSPAQACIERLEPFARGYFAGLVGWCDSSGNGDWAVAIRCGEVEGTAVRLFAGAGIVAGSNAESEVRETAAKLNTLLNAFDLSIEDLTSAEAEE